MNRRWGLLTTLAVIGAVTHWGCQPPPTNDPLSWTGRSDQGGGTEADANEPLPTGGAGGSTMTTPPSPVKMPPNMVQDAAAPPRTDVALPPRTDASTGSPDTRSADVAVMKDAPPVGMGSPSCKLAVSLTTVTTGKNYDPKNVGAIWIADDAGKFLKTLKVWAGTRITHLNKWNAVTTAAGLARSKVDAVTGGTISTQQTHSAAWTCTDASKAPVADGSYQLCMEMTESNAAGPTGCVSFMKGATAAKTTPADLSNFKGLTLDFTP